MQKQSNSGFTLVEIMVVVAVIGILASMSTLFINKSIQSARREVALAELEMISAAILQLAWDTGKWPDGTLRTAEVSGANEVWDLSRSGLMNGTGFGDNWKGPYYDGSFLDPWDNLYCFDSDYTAGGKIRVVVASFGPNGVGKNVYDKDNVWVAVDNGDPQSSEEN